MKLKILGSGGALRIPRACCTCKICNEARIKGIPYKRSGQSLYLYHESVLFDTPEDINEELNNFNIPDVKHIFYTHWHPDHTLGSRIVEVLMDSRQNKDPINIHMPPENIEITFNKNNSLFGFYQSLGYCKIMNESNMLFGEISIERIMLLNNYVSAFLIKEGNKKVLFCPCHSLYLPNNDDFYNLDLLIMGLGSFNSIEDSETNFERDSLRITRLYKPRKVIFTHIEETEGLSYDDYKNLEQKYGFIFSYDGMNIII